MINKERQQVDEMCGKGFIQLHHKDLLKKVPVVLGDEMSEKFFSHINVPGPNGGYRQSPAYILPKREAALLAMSYSYAIQARVWDHMTALEDQARQQAPAAIPTNFVEALRLALEKAEEVERVQAVVAAQVLQIEHKDAQT